MLAFRADLQAVSSIYILKSEIRITDKLDVERVNLLLKLRIMRRWSEGMWLLIRVSCELCKYLGGNADGSDKPPRGKNWQDIR